MTRKNCLDQLLLSLTLCSGRGLQILVGHTDIAVTQVIADRQLMFSHFRQTGSHRVAKRVPAYTTSPEALERGANLLLIPLRDQLPADREIVEMERRSAIALSESF